MIIKKYAVIKTLSGILYSLTYIKCIYKNIQINNYMLIYACHLKLNK